VAAYLPNIPETMVAFLATVSIGAVWSVCAPDMGTNAVLDRFRQIDPVVLIACDGVTYGGRDFDRWAWWPRCAPPCPPCATSSCTATWATPATTSIRFDSRLLPDLRWELPEMMPKWRLSSRSGCRLTTRCGSSIPAAPPACPSPSCTGTAARSSWRWRSRSCTTTWAAATTPTTWGERYHWYSSTGWVMWNAQTSGLLNGTTCVIYDGNPGGSKDRPDWTTLWRFAAELG
jgi:acetoacetyl-CoA synthetase